MLVILPFEKEFYKKWNYEVEYVGHPLVEVVEEFGIREFGIGNCKMTASTSTIPNYKDQLPVIAFSRQPPTGDLEKTSHHAGSGKTFSGLSICSCQSTGLEESFYDELLHLIKMYHLL